MGNSRSREASAGHQAGAIVQNQQRGAASGSSNHPQIRCYTCHGIFMTTQPADHIRCPYCSTINGVSSGAGPSSSQTGGQTPTAAASALAAQLAAAGAGSGRGRPGNLSASAQERQEQLLRRLQAREITPLELLILREFVEHLQQNRTGANMREIEQYTAPWVVDDVMKLPEELRTCCVCLEEVCVGCQVRSLPCMHTFHAACAEEWLQKKKVCPLCQFPIDSTGEEEPAPAPSD